MDNPETLLILATQDTGRRQTKAKTTEIWAFHDGQPDRDDNLEFV